MEGWTSASGVFRSALTRESLSKSLHAPTQVGSFARHLLASALANSSSASIDSIIQRVFLREWGRTSAFFVDNADQRGRVTYLQIAPTSRSEVPEYAAVSRSVNEALGRINGSLGEPGWVPIHYVTSAYPRSVLAGLYRLASVGLVTPMRDGMNLVAKEYVAAQDPTDPGVIDPFQICRCCPTALWGAYRQSKR